MFPKSKNLTTFSGIGDYLGSKASIIVMLYFSLIAAGCASHKEGMAPPDPDKIVLALRGQINNWEYLWLIFSFVIVIRIIMSSFKAFAIRQGEADVTKDGIMNGDYVFSGKSWWVSFRNTFIGFSRHRNRRTIDDYWLSAIIGSLDLYVYPVLMMKGEWKIIGS